MEKSFKIERPIVGYIGRQVKADENVEEGQVQVLRKPRQNPDTDSLSLYVSHSLCEGRLWVDASGLKIEPGIEHDTVFNASIEHGVLTEK